MMREAMAIYIETLKSIPYFDSLAPGELVAISRLFFEKTAGRGEVILLEGEPAETLYFVASGVAKIFKTSPEGREQILNIVRPGESINDVSVFGDGPNLASVQAMGPVVLYGIRRGEVQAILHDYPKVALNIIRVLADRVRKLTGLVEDLSFRHVISRVAKILLEYSGDSSVPRPKLTQQEMAGLAGTVREVVARSLKALEDGGLIRFDHHRIIVANREALAKIAEVSV